MIQNSHGGPIEYVVVMLMALHVLLAPRLIRRWKAKLPRWAFFALAALIVSLWSTTLFSLYLIWTGTMYSSRTASVTLRTAIVATGYFWIVLSSLALATAALVRRLSEKLNPQHLPGRRALLHTAGIAAFVAPSAVAAFGVLVARNQYRVFETDLPVAGLHSDFEGFRIVQVSDFHVSPFLSPREAGRVVDMANELRPNLTVFTGDLISELGDPLDDAIRELIRLRADSGVLGCMGNHEQYVGCRNYLEREAGRAGLLFLRGKTTQIRRGAGILNIAGVDYQRNGDPRGYLPGAEHLVVPGVSNLLLSHNPDVFPTAIRRGFQAILSGHTHGGQVNVEILQQNINPARFRTPYTSGLYRLGEASCFVTNGIGTIGIPVRLGAPPEVALLRLRRA